MVLFFSRGHSCLRALPYEKRQDYFNVVAFDLERLHSAVNRLNESIDSTPLADIKNEVAKQLVIRTRAADLADKNIVNYFQVVRAVVASAVSSEGEQLYPRNWNLH